MSASSSGRDHARGEVGISVGNRQDDLGKSEEDRLAARSLIDAILGYCVAGGTFSNPAEFRARHLSEITGE
jgi:hypothetical protein